MSACSFLKIVRVGLLVQWIYAILDLKSGMRAAGALVSVGLTSRVSVTYEGTRGSGDQGIRGRGDQCNIEMKKLKPNVHTVLTVVGTSLCS